MTRILGISGSPRKGGNSDTLLKHILAGAKRTGAITEAIHLRDYQFLGCIGCEKCRKAKKCIGLQDGMQLIYPKIKKAGGIVLTNPTHNHNVTAWMKAFIDRLYCYYNFSEERPGSWSSRLAGQNRKAIIASIGEQNSYEEGIGFALEAMRIPIKDLGFEVIAELPVLGVFGKGGIGKDVLQQAEVLGSELAKQLGSARSVA
ncbi:MAG TPA: flavodoxin family protein [Dehalococcoidia bacterium]|nr:flavodoxin family protein [Dehalococcoidia bacterium]